MFGKLNLEEFTGLTSMPQKAASAWSGFESAGLVGASYKPLLFYATQLVKGTNYYFIAEQTLTTHPIIRRVVKLVINEFEGLWSPSPARIFRHMRRGLLFHSRVI